MATSALGSKSTIFSVEQSAISEFSFAYMHNKTILDYCSNFSMHCFPDNNNDSYCFKPKLNSLLKS